MHPFLFFIGQQMLGSLGPEFIPNHIIIKKFLQAKKYLIFGWIVGGLSSIWLVCGWFGWFVDGLDSLWVVLRFTANPPMTGSDPIWVIDLCDLCT